MIFISHRGNLSGINKNEENKPEYILNALNSNFSVEVDIWYKDGSYAKTEKNNNIVLEVAEKKVISNNATAGVYFWKYGSDYVKYSERMIKKNIRVNNEFYVCPVYNEAILDKKNIIIYSVEKMWGLGTPQDLEFFKNNYKYFI
jgi:hypothetical protein